MSLDSTFFAAERHVTNFHDRHANSDNRLRHVNDLTWKNDYDSRVFIENIAPFPLKCDRHCSVENLWGFADSAIHCEYENHYTLRRLSSLFIMTVKRQPRYFSWKMHGIMGKMQRVEFMSLSLRSSRPNPRNLSMERTQGSASKLFTSSLLTRKSTKRRS